MSIYIKLYTLTLVHIIANCPCDYVLLSVAVFAFFHVLYEFVVAIVSFVGIFTLLKLYFYIGLSIAILYNIAAFLIMEKQRPTYHWKYFCMIFEYEIILDIMLQISGHKYLYALITSQIILSKLWEQKELRNKGIGIAYILFFTLETLLMGSATQLPPGLLLKLLVATSNLQKQ